MRTFQSLETTIYRRKETPLAEGLSNITWLHGLVYLNNIVNKLKRLQLSTKGQTVTWFWSMVSRCDYSKMWMSPFGPRGSAWFCPWGLSHFTLNHPPSRLVFPKQTFSLSSSTPSSFWPLCICWCYSLYLAGKEDPLHPGLDEGVTCSGNP